MDISFVRTYKIPLILGSICVVSLIISVVILIRSVQPKNDVEFVMGESSAAGQISGSDKKITVDISGGVVIPGVYHLAIDSRVDDVITAAGGLGKNANMEMIGKTINRAQKLQDGMKVYIPIQEDNTSHNNILEGISTSHNNQSGKTGSDLISINFSSQGDIESLSGVGPATAVKIISGRPYSTTDELVTKKIIGSKLYEKIKDQLSL